MKHLIYLLLMLPLYSLASGAADIDKSDIEKAKAFINKHPIIEDELDEAGVVDLWQRIEGLHNLISLWKNNPETFKQLGPEEPRHWRWQILKRIWSHMLHAKYTGEDEQVKALTAMIRLHANFAEHCMNNKIIYSYYKDVAQYTEANGLYLAEQIKKKYGKNTKR